MPQTRQHLMLAKQIGVPNLVVFVNKADLVDQEVLELVEIETREVLDEFGFDGAATQIIHGSALSALEGSSSEVGVPSVENLLSALDSLASPERELTVPFALPVEKGVTITGRGTVIVGTVERGTLRKGDKLAVIGHGEEAMTTTASGIQIFGKDVAEAAAGDHVGILCRGLKKQAIDRGQWLVGQAGVEPYTVNRFKAELYFLTESEGGRSDGLASGFQRKMLCTTWTQLARVSLSEETGLAMPGDVVPVGVTLFKPMPLVPGLRFTLRTKEITLAAGVVGECLPLRKHYKDEDFYVTSKRTALDDDFFNDS